jgi:hypothetical protein
VRGGGGDLHVSEMTEKWVEGSAEGTAAGTGREQKRGSRLLAKQAPRRQAGRPAPKLAASSGGHDQGR